MAAPVLFRSGDVEASPQQPQVDRTVTTGPQRRSSATTPAEIRDLLFTDSQQVVRGLRIKAGAQPQAKGALVAQGQPVVSNDFILSRRLQPLPVLPDVRLPERRLVPITEPNIIFTGAGQVVSKPRATTGRQPRTSDIAPALNPTSQVEVVLPSHMQPTPISATSANQPLADSTIADAAGPFVNNDFVLLRRPQPLPPVPDIPMDERRFVLPAEPNVIFVDAVQTVPKPHATTARQPLMSDIGPALNPSTPAEVVLPAHLQPVPLTATSANQPLADSTIAASAPTPTAFDYTWRGPGAQPLPGPASSGDQPLFDAVGPAGAPTPSGFDYTWRGPGDQPVPDPATAGAQPTFDATLPAVSPTPAGFDFVWRTVPMPVFDPPRTGPQPLPNEAALVQPSGDLASSRTVVIIMPPPQSWWRQQPAAAIVQGQPTPAAFVLRMLFQPVPLPVGSADQPRTSPFAAVISPSDAPGDIAFTESMVVVVASAPAPIQRRPSSAVVADQGQVVVPVMPAPLRPPVPAPTVTGAQPLPDSVLAAAFPTPAEFAFTWRGPGDQPNPGIPVTGDQPIFDAAVAAAFPTPQPFDYTWRGPGVQPVPGPAVAGRQPYFILAAWYGEARELQFSWRAWFQPPPGLPTSGTQPRVVVSVYAAVAQPFFYIPPPRPQPLPDPAIAGAQPLARVAWFLQAVLLHFAWRPWPQPVPGVAVSGPQPLMFRGVATTLFRRLVELVAQRRYFRRLNTRYTVSYTSRWTAERQYFRREDS